MIMHNNPKTDIKSNPEKNNIILTGMPGAGKSTLGVVLAKILGYDFLDSDLLIQSQEKRRLPDIIDSEGIEGFIRIENEINSAIRTSRTVIATGGSVVYGKEAMEHLKSIGTVVYLKIPYDELAMRLGSLKNRGVVLYPGESLEDLYARRTPLYEYYADITIEESGKSLEESLAAVIEALNI